MSTLRIQKRIIRYEFVIRTTSSVAENVTVLEDYLADQSRPRGFLLADTRLAGTVSGSAFDLRPWDSMLWGTAVPGIQGYFVPTPEGSDVLVAVGYDLPPWTRWLLAAVILLVMIWNIPNGLAAVLLSAFVCLVGMLLLVVPPLFHGSHTADIFARMYKATAA